METLIRSAPAPLVWINGYPGAGKLTVAKAMKDLDPSIIILDNHQLIDPVEAKFPRSHPQYQHERQVFRKKMLEKCASDPARLAQALVCTDFQSSNELGRSVAADYEKAAQKAGREFIPVSLLCDPLQNIERICSDERVNGGTTKLTDAVILQKLYKSELYRFQQYPLHDVDSTVMSPVEVAREILDLVAGKSAFANLAMEVICSDGHYQVDEGEG